MPKQVIVALGVETCLIAVTCILLAQPKAFFRAATDRARAAAHWGGMVLLCVTFCWSVIFGCILALNELTLQL